MFIIVSILSSLWCYPRHPYMGNKGKNDTCFKKLCFGISCDRLSSGLLVNPFTYQCK